MSYERVEPVRDEPSTYCKVHKPINNKTHPYSLLVRHPNGDNKMVVTPRDNNRDKKKKDQRTDKDRMFDELSDHVEREMRDAVPLDSNKVMSLPSSNPSSDPSSDTSKPLSEFEKELDKLILALSDEDDKTTFVP